MRNISVRLWLTFLVAVPAGFYVMPWFSRFWTGSGMMGVFFCFSAMCYTAISVLMHLTGTWMIQKRIQEAEAWEQAGIPARAEKKFFQAVRIYDSFLLSPVRFGKAASMITRALARFALTFNRKNGHFSQAVRVHLASDPHDEALAALWLKQLGGEDKNVTPKDQALLTGLARNHCDHPQLLPLLARIFLDSRRMDFTARQIYARVMEDPELKSRFQTDIEALMDIETLMTDTSGIRATLPGEPVWKRQKRATAEKMPDISEPDVGIWKGIQQTGRRFRSKTEAAWQAAGSFSGRLITGVIGPASWRFSLKAAFMGVLCLGMVVFVYHTISYLKTPEPEPVAKTEIVIEERVPKPFTIQVAAYLTDTHAKEYVARLTKQGVDARIKQTAAGGKTWYLIHVSEFENRQTAAAYGNHLKSENIIEEFFVSNQQ
jgi:hypothetical protein